jgi:hypothetical protein
LVSALDAIQRGIRMLTVMFVAAAMFAICFGVTAYAMRENGEGKEQASGLRFGADL